MDTAKTLQRELYSLEKSPGGGLRETISKAFLKKQKAKGLEKIKRSLDEYQKTLDSKAIIKIIHGIAVLETQQKAQNTNLERLSQLSTDLSLCHVPIANLLKSEIDKVITTIEAQHSTTRQHITAEVQRLEISQNQRHNEQKNDETSRRQYEHFIESLRFGEMSSRKNEVSSSHPETFHWILREEEIQHRWDNFATWLKGGDPIYWINGKAGSGKSTLMKFLANDPQTKELLAHWSPNKEALIVATYFWLSGSILQRSWKGFLCSIIHQMVCHDRKLVEASLEADKTFGSKRSISDWSNDELRYLLMQLIHRLGRPICVFIDGLDEFDQHDDVEKVLSLVEELSLTKTTKVCVSSRPEHYLVQRLCNYPQLRLQDLTAVDMQKCIYDTLKHTRTQCRPSPVTSERLEEVVEIIAGKADGVFLWVYYALNSLKRGMRNMDDFTDLLNRVEDLPSGMHQLYLEMWNRLNEDQQRYHDEAKMYFSYGECYPLTLFELLVAMDADLQNEYLDNLRSQEPEDLAERCGNLQTRILTRCAGLLEIVEPDADPDEGSSPDADPDQEFSDLSSGNISDQAKDNIDTLPRSENNSKRALQLRPATREMDGSSVNDSLSDTDSRVRQELYNTNLLRVCHTKIKFLHRTARDFLMNSDQGRKLIGRPEEVAEERSRAVIRARTAALLQGLTDFDRRSIRRIMYSLVDFRSPYETELVVNLKRICQKLSVPGLPQRHIGYQEFWRAEHGPFYNFETAAAQKGFVEYIQQYVLEGSSSIDPYYRGYLALCATANLEQENLALVCWLVSNGADIYTRHVSFQDSARVPLCEILLLIYRGAEIGLDEPINWAVRILQILLPLEKPSNVCLTSLSYSKEGWEMGEFWESWVICPKRHLLVQMSISQLCFYVMQHLEDVTDSRIAWR